MKTIKTLLAVGAALLTLPAHAFEAIAGVC